MIKTREKATKLPDKWKDFSNFGDIVPGTNILITKVPLTDDFFEVLVEISALFRHSAVFDPK